MKLLSLGFIVVACVLSGAYLQLQISDIKTQLKSMPAIDAHSEDRVAVDTNVDQVLASVDYTLPSQTLDLYESGRQSERQYPEGTVKQVSGFGPYVHVESVAMLGDIEQVRHIGEHLAPDDVDWYPEQEVVPRNEGVFVDVEALN